jgi:hypothetical protein
MMEEAQQANAAAARAALESMLEWLRNGATVVGKDPVTVEYRETCLERAYVIASQDLTPALLAVISSKPFDSVYNQHLHNLIDVSAMMQKKTIMRPLLPPPPPPKQG